MLVIGRPVFPQKDLSKRCLNIYIHIAGWQVSQPGFAPGYDALLTDSGRAGRGRSQAIPVCAEMGRSPESGWIHLGSALTQEADSSPPG